jgi:hypothetical protein
MIVTQQKIYPSVTPRKVKRAEVDGNDYDVIGRRYQRIYWSVVFSTLH